MWRELVQGKQVLVARSTVTKIKNTLRPENLQHSEDENGSNRDDKFKFTKTNCVTNFVHELIFQKKLVPMSAEPEEYGTLAWQERYTADHVSIGKVSIALNQALATHKCGFNCGYCTVLHSLFCSIAVLSGFYWYAESTLLGAYSDGSLKVWWAFLKEVDARKVAEQFLQQKLVLDKLVDASDIRNIVLNAFNSAE